jgi:hypothetical protein
MIRERTRRGREIWNGDYSYYKEEDKEEKSGIGEVEEEMEINNKIINNNLNNVNSVDEKEMLMISKYLVLLLAIVYCVWRQLIHT